MSEQEIFENVYNDETGGISVKHILSDYWLFYIDVEGLGFVGWLSHTIFDIDSNECLIIEGVDTVV